MNSPKKRGEIIISNRARLERILRKMLGDKHSSDTAKAAKSSGMRRVIE